MLKYFLDYNITERGDCPFITTNIAVKSAIIPGSMTAVVDTTIAHPSPFKQHLNIVQSTLISKREYEVKR